MLAKVEEASRLGTEQIPGAADERDVLQSSVGEAGLPLQVAQVHPALSLLVDGVGQVVRARHHHLQ